MSTMLNLELTLFKKQAFPYKCFHKKQNVFDQFPSDYLINMPWQALGYAGKF